MHNLKNIILKVLAVFGTKEKEKGRGAFSAEADFLGLPAGQWLEQITNRKQLYIDLDESTVEVLKTSFKQQVEKTVLGADRIMAHSFNLLGSGPFLPVDPTRPDSRNGYSFIDWYLDPVRQLSFPRKIHHKQWDLFKMRPGKADIKLPWELARCQHFVTLGQAFRLTGDSRYGQEIINQIDDFMDANPVGLGINWTCTMDVAIRAANWALGLTLVKSCKAVPDESKLRAYGHLFDHGSFIYNNFENTYEVTSNHYLSNIVGLYFISVIFDGLPSAADWQTCCREAIPNEIDIQILNDGADFESSIPYHRLVLELFLGAARLAEVQNHRFSDHYYARLSQMTEFLYGVMRPDGRMPVIGDADDGRLHIFTNYNDWDRQDGRHILAPAAMLLNRKDWLHVCGPDEMWEAAWWGFNIDGRCSRQGTSPMDSIRHYPDAGISVMRRGGDYLLVSNSSVGTKGFGNHKHNDQLSFELHFNGRPLIVDPGSYVYTSDFESRNLFRSTAYHNTLQSDGQEQNEFNPEWLFRMFEKADAKHLSFREGDEYTQYVGRHSGYQHLDRPLTHIRCFRFLKQRQLLIILDTLQGLGEHELKWHFHFAPGLKLFREKEMIIAAEGDNNAFFIMTQPQLNSVFRESWHSPSYGIKTRCASADFILSVDVEPFKSFCYVLGAYAEMGSEDLSGIIDSHQTQMSHNMVA